MKKKNWILSLFMIIVMFSTINVYAADTCEGVFGQELLDEVRSVFRIIQIAAPILLLLLTSLDFAKVVFSDGKDGFDKAKNNFFKRGIAVLIIFFAPMIVNLILELVNENSMKACLNQFN